MKECLALMFGSIVALGCTLGSKNAGDLQDTGEGSGTASDGTATDGDATDGATGSVDGDGTAGTEGGTTGGTVPAACEEAGWVSAYEIFQQMSTAADQTYWYRVLDGGEAVFVQDCLYRTTIVVEGGEAVRRIFEVLGPPPDDPELECAYESFVEEKDELGTHDETFYQRPAWTLDQLYLGCCEDVLTQPPEENYITFSTDAQGMMAACSFFPMDCADGCSAGPEGYGYIAIDSMGFGPLPPD